MPAKPLWKDYLSAAVRTGAKVAGSFVPGVAQALEVIETLETRREAESRHGPLERRGRRRYCREAAAASFRRASVSAASMLR